jgi:hypothetical protein
VIDNGETPDDASEDASRYARPAAGIPLQAGAAAEAPPMARETRPTRGSGVSRPAVATILRFAGPPAALAVIATIALVVALVLLEGQRNAAVNSWLLAIGGIVLWALWRAIGRSVPASRQGAFDNVRRVPPDPPSKLPEVIAIEAVLLDAEWSWSGVEHRLRPLLRRLAADRLLDRRQIDIETEPNAARQILGEELWALVAPGAYGPLPGGPHDQPADRPDTPHRRGIPRATIRDAVKVLEEL